jgi:hypothetical protein
MTQEVSIHFTCTIRRIIVNAFGVPCGEKKHLYSSTNCEADQSREAESVALVLLVRSVGLAVSKQGIDETRLKIPLCSLQHQTRS